MELLEENKFFNRDDIAGKIGITNNSVSTWFSGFHKDPVTTVWVGTDDFSSLGENEYGSTIALLIWLNFADFKQKVLKCTKILYLKIFLMSGWLSSGEIDSDTEDNFYFELFLNENIN